MDMIDRGQYSKPSSSNSPLNQRDYPHKKEHDQKTVFTGFWTRSFYRYIGNQR